LPGEIEVIGTSGFKNFLRKERKKFSE
jgi:hypothetical protein